MTIYAIFMVIIIFGFLEKNLLPIRIVNLREYGDKALWIVIFCGLSRYRKSLIIVIGKDFCSLLGGHFPPSVAWIRRQTRDTPTFRWPERIHAWQKIDGLAITLTVATRISKSPLLKWVSWFSVANRHFIQSVFFLYSIKPDRVIKSVVHFLEVLFSSRLQKLDSDIRDENLDRNYTILDSNYVILSVVHNVYKGFTLVFVVDRNVVRFW